jgi:methionine-rich copper-binding protein CopC
MLTLVPSPFVFVLRSLPALLLLVFGVIAQPHLASAHADLESSNPPAGGTVAALPAKMTLTFAEEVKPGSAVVEVTGPNGARADAGDADVDLTDATRKTVSVSLFAGGPGAYAVHWETVSNTDNHPLSGNFTFTVSGSAAGATPAATPTEVSAADLTPTVEPTLDPANGNPLSPEGDFDSRALAISVGAGLIGVAAIVGFWLTVRPKNPRFGPRSGRDQR